MTYFFPLRTKPRPIGELILISETISCFSSINFSKFFTTKNPALVASQIPNGIWQVGYRMVSGRLDRKFFRLKYYTIRLIEAQNYYFLKCHFPIPCEMSLSTISFQVLNLIPNLASVISTFNPPNLG